MIKDVWLTHETFSASRVDGTDSQRLLDESKIPLKGCQDNAHGALELHAGVREEGKRRGMGQKES